MVNGVHGLGYKPVCEILISGLQSGNVSCFGLLEALLNALYISAESLEEALTLGRDIDSDTNTCVNRAPLASAHVGLCKMVGTVSCVIQDAKWDEGKKEKIASRFLQAEGSSLTQLCWQVLSDLDKSRRVVDPLSECDTSILCHISNAVTALVDVAAILCNAPKCQTGHEVGDESSTVKETQQRVDRRTNASEEAVHTPQTPAQSSVRIGSTPVQKVRGIAHRFLMEAASVAGLMHDEEKEITRKSAPEGHEHTSDFSNTNEGDTPSTRGDQVPEETASADTNAGNSPSTAIEAVDLSEAAAYTGYYLAWYSR
ncbi:hypothetical protein APHMUC_0526 [Anaplasma phagocytophilum str. ApMUC09]|uniref:Uncharacterized protein n=1 Tax=Anaplasma phagocytophilum str. ApMUC09 TaxID=1359152 RepID=A0A0F3NCQ1_ANAPH|nr:hypothetical protein APHMUC_0526 [Anaplasma phagocytophilum str. ApMUC09]